MIAYLRGTVLLKQAGLSLGRYHRRPALGYAG